MSDSDLPDNRRPMSDLVRDMGLVAVVGGVVDNGRVVGGTIIENPDLAKLAQGTIPFIVATRDKLWTESGKFDGYSLSPATVAAIDCGIVSGHYQPGNEGSHNAERTLYITQF